MSRPENQQNKNKPIQRPIRLIYENNLRPEEVQIMKNVQKWKSFLEKVKNNPNRYPLARNMNERKN